MRRRVCFAFLLTLIAALVASCGGSKAVTGDQDGDLSVAPDQSGADLSDASTASKTFKPDPGIRVEGGIPSAGIAPDGTVYLYYNAKGEMVATSSDGLTFGAGTKPTTFPYDPRNTALKNGWRRYAFDMVLGYVVSRTSVDGITFTAEAGARYMPDASDNSEIGIIAAFTDTKGGVVMLYIGDLHGKNNIRRAYSTDDGATFSFVEGNVFGDDNAGGGGQTYVDQRVLKLPDGSYRIYCMKGGTIYTYTMTADGEQITSEGKLLGPSDFTEFTVKSLHDPSAIRLPDGRYRVYMGAMLNTANGQKEVILSATSQ